MENLLLNKGKWKISLLNVTSSFFLLYFKIFSITGENNFFMGHEFFKISVDSRMVLDNLSMILKTQTFNV